MIVYVKVYGKIIARDLRLVASRLGRMAVTRPWMRHLPLAGTLTARRYIISLFRSRPPGLQLPVQEKEWKEPIKQPFCVRTCTIQYVPLPISTAQGNLSADLAHWETPPPVAGGKTRADAICTRPRSKEEKKRREKQENVQWTLKPPYLHFRTDHAFPSL